MLALLLLVTEHQNDPRAMSWKCAAAPKMLSAPCNSIIFMMFLLLLALIPVSVTFRVILTLLTSFCIPITPPQLIYCWCLTTATANNNKVPFAGEYRELYI